MGDYSEFVAATLEQKIYMQRDVLWTAFRTFDLDGDGGITKEELQQVLNQGNVGETLGSNKVQKMITEFDVNGDGVIDFEEFCEMMKPKATAKRAGDASTSAPQKKRKPDVT